MKITPHQKERRSSESQRKMKAAATLMTPARQNLVIAPCLKRTPTMPICCFGIDKMVDITSIA
jgi:hypothetical protein